MKLLLPKTYVDIGNTPVFFLGGPIRGAGDWQQGAIIKLSEAVPEAMIVCPSRYTPEHPLYQHRLVGLNDKFESQTLWERHYLKLASTNGCIVFWIPKEDPINPRPKDGGPYCQDTYGELGEWRMHLLYNKLNGKNLNFEIGAEEDAVAGLSVIKKNFRYALGEEFVFHQDLDSVLAEAVKKVKNIPKISFK